jgi:uncharacterized membrane protein
MLKYDNGVILNNNKALLKIEVISFEKLLYSTMASLRTYCKHDPILVSKLVWMLNHLKSQKNICSDLYYEAINFELKMLLKDAKKALDNKTDWKTIKQLAKMN